MKLSEKSAIILHILSNSEMVSSSDLIVALYHIGKKVDLDLMLMIDPIYKWEYDNWRDNSHDNVLFIEKKLKNLDKEDYEEVSICYKSIMKFFIEDELMSAMFPMDERDLIGWKIYNEIIRKYEYASKMLKYCENGVPV